MTWKELNEKYGKSAVLVTLIFILAFAIWIQTLPMKPQFQEVSVKPGVTLVIKNGCNEDQMIFVHPGKDKKTLEFQCVEPPDGVTGPDGVNENLYKPKAKNDWLIRKR